MHAEVKRERGKGGREEEEEEEGEGEGVGGEMEGGGGRKKDKTLLKLGRGGSLFKLCRDNMPTRAHVHIHTRTMRTQT